jgi:allantoin racemase
MARVLVIVPYPMSEEGVANRRAQQDAVNIDPSIEFVYHPVKAAPRLGETYHDGVLFELAIFEAGCEAESDGFDAVCLDTVSDSGLRPLRALLTIPVVGAGATSYHFALTLGRRFSILTQWDRWVREAQDQVADYGLADHCASVRSIGLAPDPSGLLGGKEEDVFPRLLEAAEQCVSDGADVICLGSTTMHQSHAYLAERLPVPVINPGPLTYKLIELMLTLGLRHSKAAYPAPQQDERALLHSMLNAAATHRASESAAGLSVSS